MLSLTVDDVVAYSVGYTTENDEEWIVKARVRDMIGKILETVGTSDYQIYLSDSKGNFRLQLFPNYKGNRTQPKPRHLPFIQQLLVDTWDAEVAMEQEADDALGIAQTEDMLHAGCFEAVSTIICSKDKDLKQIPGMHYDWYKEEIFEVTPHEGLYWFYYQLLVGDTGDNITVKQGLSCPGIGPKKAQRALEGCETEQEMYEVCRELYQRQWKDDTNGVNNLWEDALLLTGKLIKIRTKPGEIWQPPKLEITDSGINTESA